MEDRYRRLVHEHRRELQAHCYRRLGSVADAEDALQETLLRAWRGLPRFEGRSSQRAWLYRIASNVCVDATKRRHGSEPLTDESVALESALGLPESRYDERESVELAFVAAVQHLSPSQRAVLILREVLGYSAREVASMLGTSVPAVNSALQRARAAVEKGVPAQPDQASARSLDDEALRRLVDDYVDAWARADIDAVAALLLRFTSSPD